MSTASDRAALRPLMLLFINTMTYFDSCPVIPGINVSSHRWSKGTLVPEQNPWLTRRLIPYPKEVEHRQERVVQPRRGWDGRWPHPPRVPRVTAVTALHPWLFKLNPVGVRLPQADRTAKT